MQASYYDDDPPAFHLIYFASIPELIFVYRENQTAFETALPSGPGKMEGFGREKKVLVHMQNWKMIGLFSHVRFIIKQRRRGAKVM